MTKLNRWIMAALVGWLVMVSENSVAGLISWQYFSTRAGVEALFGTAGVSTIATGQFRAGGATAPEIRVQNGEFDVGQPFDQGDLTWDITGGNNTLNAEYGDLTTGGIFDLGATGSGGTTDSAYSLPTEWFNQVLVDLSSDSAIISFLGDMNGQGFNIGVDPSTFEPDDTYDAILFTFDNAVGTTPEFALSANMSMTTPYPELSNDAFRSDVYLFQNVNVVPEPGTFGLFGLGILVLGARKIRRRLQIG